MSLHSGERQVAPTIEGIRRDHVARYEWAEALLGHDYEGFQVVDVGCGCGYGSFILSGNFSVLGIDNDPDALEYAKSHYGHGDAEFELRNLEIDELLVPPCAAVCFEVIEHLRNPKIVLRRLGGEDCVKLLASVPNEAVYPHASLVNPQHHVRHYTKVQFEELLTSCGWKVQAWYTQDGPDSEVRPGDNGMTLIVDAVRG